MNRSNIKVNFFWRTFVASGMFLLLLSEATSSNVFAEDVLSKTLNGHTGSVMTVAFSPDGKTLASGSTDKTVKLWDVRTGTALQTFAPQNESVYSIAFSPDGSILASGSRDKKIRLWDVQTGQIKQILHGHSDTIHFLAFSPDGNTLASGSWDRTIKLWDLQQGILIRTLEGLTEPVHVFEFTRDGTKLDSYNNKEFLLWDVDTGALVEKTNRRKVGLGKVTKQVFSPDRTTVASFRIFGREIMLRDKEKRESTLEGHTAIVKSLAFSPDGRILASGSSDKTIKLWNVQLSLSPILTNHSDSTAFHIMGIQIGMNYEEVLEILNSKGLVIGEDKRTKSPMVKDSGSPEAEKIIRYVRTKRSEQGRLKIYFEEDLPKRPGVGIVSQVQYDMELPANARLKRAAYVVQFRTEFKGLGQPTKKNSAHDFEWVDDVNRTKLTAALQFHDEMDDDGRYISNPGLFSSLTRVKSKDPSIESLLKLFEANSTQRNKPVNSQDINGR